MSSEYGPDVRDHILRTYGTLPIGAAQLEAALAVQNGLSTELPTDAEELPNAELPTAELPQFSDDSELPRSLLSDDSDSENGGKRIATMKRPASCGFAGPSATPSGKGKKPSGKDFEGTRQKEASSKGKALRQRLQAKAKQANGSPQ